MCPGPLSWLCPPSPWGHQRSTQGQHCRRSWTVRRGHLGKFPGGCLIPSSGLASVQEKPPCRVWERWLMWWEVQEQGCTSHITGCPAQILPGQRNSLITLGFSHEEMSSKAKHNQKIKTKLPAWQKSGKHLYKPKPRSHGKCWVSSPSASTGTAAQASHSPGTPWFQCPAGLHPASLSLGSFPRYSRQQTSSSANWAWAHPPQLYNTTQSLQQKLYQRLSSQKPLSLWQQKLWMFLKLEASQLDGDTDSLPQSFWSLQIKRWKIPCQSQTASNYTKTDKFFSSSYLDCLAGLRMRKPLYLAG